MEQDDHIFIVNDGDAGSVSLRGDMISAIEHCKPYFASASARNKGIVAALNDGFEYGIFVDDDVMIRDNALLIHKAVVGMSSNPKTLFVGKMFLNGHILGIRTEEEVLKFGGMCDSVFNIPELWAAGGYNDAFDGGWGFNDTELVNRLVKKYGWKIRFTNASADHLMLDAAVNNYSRDDHGRNKALFEELTSGY